MIEALREYWWLVLIATVAGIAFFCPFACLVIAIRGGG